MNGLNMAMKALHFLMVFFAVVIVGVTVVQYLGIDVGDGDCKYRHENVDRDGESDYEISFPADFPSGTRIVCDSPNSRGWRQLGMMPLAIDSAEGFVSSLMAGKRFSLKQKQPSSEGGNVLLLEFRGSDGKSILWMLWQVDAGQTGFTWGVST